MYTFIDLVGRLGRQLGGRLKMVAGLAVCLLYGVWAVSFFQCYFTEFPQAIRRQFNADFVEIVREADGLEAYDTLYITVNMGWNSGKQMAEILTQYACCIDPAYSQGVPDTEGARPGISYAERYRFAGAAEMAVAMAQELTSQENAAKETLYIYYRGELGHLPEGFVTILENESYVAVEIPKEE